MDEVDWVAGGQAGLQARGRAFYLWTNAVEDNAFYAEEVKAGRMMQQSYYALTPERALKMQEGALVVLTACGMKKDEAQGRGWVALFPFDRALDDKLVAKTRWAVLEYIRITKEPHREVRLQIEAACVRDGIQPCAPKNDKKN